MDSLCPRSEHLTSKISFLIPSDRRKTLFESYLRAFSNLKESSIFFELKAVLCRCVKVGWAAAEFVLPSCCVATQLTFKTLWRLKLFNIIPVVLPNKSNKIIKCWIVKLLLLWLYKTIKVTGPHYCCVNALCMILVLLKLCGMFLNPFRNWWFWQDLFFLC